MKRNVSLRIVRIDAEQGVRFSYLSFSLTVSLGHGEVTLSNTYYYFFAPLSSLYDICFQPEIIEKFLVPLL